MIEGLLRHCTSMKVEKNYVDSHGQSEVANVRALDSIIAPLSKILGCASSSLVYTAIQQRPWPKHRDIVVID